MNLTFKRREVKDLQHLGTLVADNAEAIEPDLKIIGSNLNLGRASVELVAIDSRGDTSTDHAGPHRRRYDAPEGARSIRLVPGISRVDPEAGAGEDSDRNGRPRVVFVAERLLESFVRKMRLLRILDCRFLRVSLRRGQRYDRLLSGPRRLGATPRRGLRRKRSSGPSASSISRSSRRRRASRSSRGKSRSHRAGCRAASRARSEPEPERDRGARAGRKRSRRPKSRRS